MRRVHVPHLETGTLPGQPPRPQGGEPSLVGQAGQRVGLVHELRELAGPEELLYRRYHRPDVDQGLRGYRVYVLGGHTFPDHPLHAGKPYPNLVLYQLTNGPHPAVPEVVDVIDVPALPLVDVHDVADRLQDVLPGEDGHVLGDGKAKFLV